MIYRRLISNYANFKLPRVISSVLLLKKSIMMMNSNEGFFILWTFKKLSYRRLSRFGWLRCRRCFDTLPHCCPEQVVYWQSEASLGDEIFNSFRDFAHLRHDENCLFRLAADAPWSLLHSVFRRRSDLGNLFELFTDLLSWLIFRLLRNSDLSLIPFNLCRTFCTESLSAWAKKK